MPYVPAPNVVQAELRYLYSIQKLENVIYFVGSAGITTTLMTTLGNNLINWWNVNFKPLVSTQLSLSEVYLTDLTTQTSPTVSVVTGLPSAGVDGGEPMPFNVAYCISFRTAGRGRSARGRNYVTGMTENDVSGNSIVGSFRDAAVAAYNLLVGAGTFTAGLQWCVVSRIHDNAPRAVALVQPITSVVTIDLVVDSQRRRLPGRGR